MLAAVAVRRHSLLFLGSDQISCICLSALAAHPPVKRVEVITPSLGTPLARTAKQLHLPVSAPAAAHDKMLQWDILQDSAPLWAQKFDFLVVASFGHFVPERLIKHFPVTLNMHPSLLPRHRGASPIQFTILKEDREAGVSIIDLHPTSFDKGKVVLQGKLADVDLKTVTYAELSVRLAQLGGDLLKRVIDNYGEMTPVQQDESLATKAPKLGPEVGKLKCGESAQSLLLRFRALYGSSIRPSFAFRDTSILPHQLRHATPAESSALSARYPEAVPGSLWVLYPALGRQEKPKAAVIKQIDPIVFIRAGDGWLAMSEFTRAGKSLTKTTLTEFVAAYLPLGKYQQHTESGAGSDIVFL